MLAFKLSSTLASVTVDVRISFMKKVPDFGLKFAQQIAP